MLKKGTDVLARPRIAAGQAFAALIVGTCLFIALFTPVASRAQVVDPEHWMEDIYGSSPRFLVKDMLIPGSHDAGSYGITRSSDISRFISTSPLFIGIKNAVDAVCIIPILPICFVDYIINDIVTGLARSQSMDTYQQAVAGARYFDVRTYFANGALWVDHGGVLSVPLEEVFSDLSDFAHSHPFELIIVDNTHLVDSAHYDELATLTQDIFGDRLLPDSFSAGTLTMGDIIATGKNVIVISKGSYANNHDFIWKNTSNNYMDSYPDTTDVNTALNRMESYLEDHLDRNGFLNYFLNLTPDTSFVAGTAVWNFLFTFGTCGSSARCTLEDLNADLAPVRSDTVTRLFSQGLPVNIVAIDFIEQGDLILQMLIRNQFLAAGNTGFYLTLDCGGGPSWAGTTNDLWLQYRTTESLGDSAYGFYQRNVGPITNKWCNSSTTDNVTIPLTVAENDHGSLLEIQLFNSGNDEFWLDRLEVYDIENTNLRNFGTGNTRGWVISTDPNDGQGSGWEHLDTNDCRVFSVASGIDYYDCGLYAPMTEVLLWLDASDAGSIIRAGSDVIAWEDVSGKSNNAVSFNSAKRPKYLSGQRAVRFDNDFMELRTLDARPTTYDTITTFAVYRYRGGYRNIWVGQKNGFGNSRRTHKAATTAHSKLHVSTVKYVNSTATRKSWLDGTLVENQSLTSGGAGVGIGLGQLLYAWHGYAGAYAANYDLHELIIVKGALPGNQRQAMEASLLAKWATQ